MHLKLSCGQLTQITDKNMYLKFFIQLPKICDKRRCELADCKTNIKANVFSVCFDRVLGNC